MFLWEAFIPASALPLKSLCQSLSLTLATGGGEFGGDSAVCASNCPVFSSAEINPSDARSSSLRGGAGKLALLPMMVRLCGGDGEGKCTAVGEWVIMWRKWGREGHSGRETPVWAPRQTRPSHRTPVHAFLQNTPIVCVLHTFNSCFTISQIC